MIRTLAAAVVALSCTVTLAGCSEKPPETKTRKPPVTLPRGNLNLVSTDPVVRNLLMGFGAPATTLVTDDRVVRVSPDDVIRVIDRASFKTIWQRDLTAPGTFTKNAYNREGVCAPPVLTKDEKRLVVPVSIEATCGQVVTLDLDDGHEVNRFRVRKAELQSSNGTTFRYFFDIRNLRTVGDQTWWYAEKAAGWINASGQGHFSLGQDAYGLGKEQTFGQAYWFAPVSDDTVAAEVEREDHRTFLLGLRSDGEQLRPAWRTPYTKAALGRTDLQTPVDLLHLTDHGAAVEVVKLTGRRYGVGRLDPATGKLTKVAVLPNRHLSLFGGSRHDDYAVQGDRVWFGLGPAGDNDSTHLTGVDLATGKRLWTSPVGEVNSIYADSTSHMRSMSVGTDGQVYALISNQDLKTWEIHRFDPETGKQTGTWTLPARAHDPRLRGYFSYDLHVIDKHVVLTYDGESPDEKDPQAAAFTFEVSETR